MIYNDKYHLIKWLEYNKKKIRERDIKLAKMCNNCIDHKTNKCKYGKYDKSYHISSECFRKE